VFKELNLDFIGRFSKNAQISDFNQIHPVEAVVFHAVSRTDGQILQFCEGT
jgi:hypothetical protein